METTEMTSAEALDELMTQGKLQPGDFGWWRVYGATTRDVQPGDFMASKVDDHVSYDYVEDVFVAKAYPLRYGFVVDGKKVTVGALAPVVVFRKGTRNILA